MVGIKQIYISLLLFWTSLYHLNIYQSSIICKTQTNYSDTSSQPLHINLASPTISSHYPFSSSVVGVCLLFIMFFFLFLRYVIMIMRGVLISRNNKLKLSIDHSRPKLDKNTSEIPTSKPSLKIVRFQQKIQNCDYFQEEKASSKFSKYQSTKKPQHTYLQLPVIAVSHKSIADGLVSRQYAKQRAEGNKQNNSFCQLKINQKKQQITEISLLGGRRKQEKRYETVVQQMVEMLESQSVVRPYRKNSYTIKKKNMICLFQQIASSFIHEHAAAGQVSQQKPLYFDFIQSFLKNLKNYQKQIHLKQYHNKAQLQSAAVSINSTNHYQQQIQNRKSQLEELLFAIESSQKTIQRLKTDILSLRQQSRRYQQVISEQMQAKLDLQEKLSKLLEDEDDYIIKVAQLKQNAILLQRESQRVLNYINQQNTQRMIQLAGEQYHRVESNFYDYVQFLQSTEFMTNLNRQSLSFSQIEKTVLVEIDLLNKALLQNSYVSSGDRIGIMRNFVLTSMDKFRKNDEETKRLSDIKTKCILGFINHINKWMDNITIKQQYLDSLRKEFVVDSRNIRDKLESMKKEGLGGSREKLVRLAGELVVLFANIQENYKLGNSFF